METMNIEENEYGIIERLVLSSGKECETIDDFIKYCKEVRTIYCEGLHKIATVLTGNGIKFRILSRFRTQVISKIKLKKTTIIDISEFRMNINESEESIRKIEELLKYYNTEMLSSSPSYYVNSAFYNYMGEFEAYRRKTTSPNVVEAILCSSKIPGQPYKNSYGQPLYGCPAKPNKVYNNVQSYDITSAYPFSAIAAAVPMREGEVVKDLTDYKISNGRIQGLSENEGFIAQVNFNGLKRKEYVRLAFLKEKDKRYGEKVIVDRIGIASAEEFRIALSPYTLELMELQYDWEGYEIILLSKHKLGKIPEKAKEFIIHSYDIKNSARGFEREMAKVKLNTIIGFWGIDPFSAGVSRKKGYEGRYRENITIEEAFEPYIGKDDNLGFISGNPRVWDFRWAEYAVSYNRLRIAKMEKKLYDAGMEVLYSDTDSIKFIGNKFVGNRIINEENEKVKSIIDHNGLGLWKNESKESYKAVFRGMKFYILENNSGKVKVKGSGIPRETLDKIGETYSINFFAKEGKISFPIERRSLAKLENDKFGAKVAYALRTVKIEY